VSGQQDFSGSSMQELFRMEVESNAAALNNGLVSVANGAVGADVLEALMRAAHSIKGAARIVGLQQAVKVAHAMEDCFVAAQKKQLNLQPDHVEVLLKGTDFLLRSGREISAASEEQAAAVISALTSIKAGTSTATATAVTVPVASTDAQSAAAAPGVKPAGSKEIAPRSSQAATTVISDSTGATDAGRAVRVNAASLSRLMGLAGESLVEAGRLTHFERTLRQLQDQHQQIHEMVERLESQTSLNQSHAPAAAGVLQELHQKTSEHQQRLAERVHAFEVFSLRSDNLSHRLYREVIASRMRPFGDGVHGYPRLVHDIARSLGKKVRSEVAGKDTEVDRDILEKLDAPLNHLLRNAIDHGMESPAQRVAAGKKEQGRIVLEAMHKGGMLFVSVTDDGCGIDVERVRRKIVERKLASSEMAANMAEAEILEFLFLPGFSTAEKVTEISGRGVGLDVVKTMIQEVSGQIRVASNPGAGCSFHLQLPLTLSVLSVLLVEISGDPYAFPLARIDRVLRIEKEQIQSLENRQYFKLDGANIGLVQAQQVLDIELQSTATAELPVIVIGARTERYGLAVDRVLGERQVVVRPLDPRLGKVPNISAASLMDDGSPLLIVDVEDLVHSINRLLTGGVRVDRIASQASAKKEVRKRVLIVDDSLTVREVERKLLANRGYDVAVAVDGAEGWNTVRSGRFDLIISDIDMPRMNGIELVTRIRADARFKNIPIMIVSYKEREEDRLKGMEAGANYYLTKSSFHDESLLEAVVELIGEPQ
jgi:two-component system sensor histidine kinase and response regulator WspE